MNLSLELVKEDLISQMRHNQRNSWEDKLRRLSKKYPELNWEKLSQDLELIEDKPVLVTKVLLKLLTSGHNRIYIDKDEVSTEFRKELYARKRGEFFKKAGILA